MWAEHAEEKRKKAQGQDAKQMKSVELSAVPRLGLGPGVHVTRNPLHDAQSNPLHGTTQVQELFMVSHVFSHARRNLNLLVDM